MGLDVTLYRGIRAVPEVHFMDAYEEEGLLDAFGNGTLATGWVGWPTDIAYSYDDKLDLPLGTWAGVSLFWRVLAAWKGHPRASEDASYRGPFCALFQSLEWMGPVDCRTVGSELASLQDAWLRPEHAKVLEVEGCSLPEFIEYYLRWRKVFDFVQEDGLINFH